MKKFNLTMLSAVMLIAGIVNANAKITKGDCGENVSYEYDDETLTINIVGEGKMIDYSYGNSPAKNLNITTVNIGSGVTSIGKYAFQDNKRITTVNISNTVTTIGSYAFSGCTALQSVNMTDGLTTIEHNAFTGCNALESISIPGTTVSIGVHAFSSCKGLKEITFSEGLTTIQREAFRDCSALESVDMPNSVTTIEDGAFYYCGALKYVKLSEGLTSLGSSAFGNTLISSVKIPGGVTTIGSWAFAYCGELTSVDIASGVKTIEHHAFYNNFKLASVNIGSTVTSIEEAAFKDCKGLAFIKIPESVTTIEKSAFSGCQTLADINLPKGLTAIKNHTFYNCSALKSITIPKKATYIGEFAFSGCSELASVTIFNSLDSIGWEAFFNCYQITDITCYGHSVITNVQTSAIPYKVRKTAILHVPQTLIETYKTTVPWRDFDNVVATTQDPYNTVFPADAVSKAGKNVTLSLMMDNEVEVVGFQCDVYLPDGVTFVKDEDNEEIIEMNPERTNDENLVPIPTIQPSGYMNLICHSMSNTPFNGNDGEVLKITVHIDKQLATGNYPIVLKNIVLTDHYGKTFLTDEVQGTLTLTSYALGDANGDEEINVADYSTIVNHIQGKTSDNFIEETADVNQDGTINVGDLAVLINIIINPEATMLNARATAMPQTLTEDSYNNLLDFDNAVYPTETKLNSDGTASISVCMKNSVDVTAYQFDMYLPDGFTYAKDENDKEIIELSTTRTTKKKHVINKGMQKSGAMRIMCTSISNKTFSGNDGEVCTVQVKAQEGIKAGSYSVVLKNIRISDSEGRAYKSENLAANIVVSEETGISSISVDSIKNCRVYSVDGTPRQSLGKGVNIVKTADGKTVKVTM